MACCAPSDKRRADAGRWPRLEFVPLDAVTGSAADTRTLVRAMRERGAAVIVVLGGDGTVRAAAAESGDVALLPLSTGTNNAFPEMWEATVAGTAAGLLATRRVAADEAGYRAKVLRVEVARATGSAREIALVDVCVSTVTHVGSRALWQPATLREVYCAFAEPHAIGLSSIAGLLHPSARTDPHGVAVRLAAPELAAPLRARPHRAGRDRPDRGPGRRARCSRGTRTPSPSSAARSRWTASGSSSSARRPRSPSPSPHDGPRILDVRNVLAAAAERRLLVSELQS